MTLLLISYMLGYDKNVRAGVWTLLAVILLGSAVGVFFMNYSNSAFAQQSEGEEHSVAEVITCDLTGLKKNEVYAHQPVDWYLTKLETLEDLHQESGFYKGGNLALSLLLRDKIDSYTQTNQLIIFANFINNLEKISSDELRVRRTIHDETLLEVYKEILAISCAKTQKGAMVSDGPIEGILLENDKATITYQIRTYRFEKDKKLVTFYVEPKGSLKGINWHFGDGTTYMCERNQCGQINHIYADDKEYTIKIFAGTVMNEGWNETITFNPWTASLNTVSSNKETDAVEETIEEIVEELDIDEETEKESETTDEMEEETIEDDTTTTEEDLEFIKSFLGIEF